MLKDYKKKKQENEIGVFRAIRERAYQEHDI
jgi:hypothetical protein